MKNWYLKCMHALYIIPTTKLIGIVIYPNLIMNTNVYRQIGIKRVYHRIKTIISYFCCIQLLSTI